MLLRVGSASQKHPPIHCGVPSDRGTALLFSGKRFLHLCRQPLQSDSTDSHAISSGRLQHFRPRIKAMDSARRCSSRDTSTSSLVPISAFLVGFDRRRQSGTYPAARAGGPTCLFHVLPAFLEPAAAWRPIRNRCVRMVACFLTAETSSTGDPWASGFRGALRVYDPYPMVPLALARHRLCRPRQAGCDRARVSPAVEVQAPGASLVDLTRRDCSQFATSSGW